MTKRLLLGILAVAVAAATAGTGAQEAAQAALGAVDSQAAAADFKTLADVFPSETYTNANFQSGGTGMRNQRRGSIMINGVVPGGVTPILKANLYWAIITSSATLTTAQVRININRQWPATPVKPASLTLNGSLVGQAPQPCWAGSVISVLKADVTPVVTGNGLYRIQVFAGGSYAGGDPWNSPVVLPLQEGASLVVIYPQNGAITSVFDRGLTTMFSGALNYVLMLPFSTGGVKIDLAGADGQYGSSRSPGLAGETTTINGVHVGATSAWNDSLWNGKSGLPLPQLWDNDGRRVNLPAVTSSLSVTHTAGGDCLVPVVNTVSNATI
jgi:hypothetical protein